MHLAKVVGFTLTIALALLAGCASQNPSGGGSPSSAPQGGSAGMPAPSSTPAPSPAPTTSSSPSGSTPPPPAQTPDERRAAIDRRLDQSMGTFDEQLRREQERVAKERDARDATAAAGGSADTNADEAAKDKQGEGEAGTAGTESPPPAGADSKPGKSQSKPGDLKSDKDRSGTASGAPAGSGAAAQNIPDGSDDDIVARRLRKAAEQETDPELKEKLWKEYIEYKKNAGK